MVLVGLYLPKFLNQFYFSHLKALSFSERYLWKKANASFWIICLSDPELAPQALFISQAHVIRRDWFEFSMQINCIGSDSCGACWLMGDQFLSIHRLLGCFWWRVHLVTSEQSLNSFLSTSTPKAVWPAPIITFAVNIANDCSMIHLRVFLRGKAAKTTFFWRRLYSLLRLANLLRRKNKRQTSVQENEIGEEKRRLKIWRQR